MWAVLDLETTVKSLAGRKGSPFHPDNWVVMAGWCTRENREPTGVRLPQEGSYERLGEIFSGLLQGRKWLVGQNIKFDVLHCIRDPQAYRAWQDWVAGGGLVWDLQQVEYVLQGQDQNSHMLSLNELALRYDEDTKVDEVKALWEAGVDTPDIDPDLLSRYLLGETLPNGTRREGDIGVTRNIFLKQLAHVKRMNMGNLIAVEAGAILATIEMEHNGMRVDRELGYKIAAELRVELAKAQEELNKYLPEDIPFEFNWSNRYHLSPLIFGGSVKYPKREYDLKNGTTTQIPPDDGHIPANAYLYAQKEELHYILDDGTTMEVNQYASMLDGWAQDKSSNAPLVQPEKYKSGKNAGEYKTKKVKVNDLTKPKGRMGESLFYFPGYAKPLPEWESGTPGLYSVSAEVMESLTANTDVPFLKALDRVTSISKDVNTYFITEDGEKGMLTLVGDDGIVHHSVHHNSTVTGRLSGSKPNLQNIPKGNKSRAKELFVSRFPGGDIGQTDFNSLEVYCQANLTNCTQLIQDLLEGKDLHCLRLASTEGMPYDEVVKLAKGYEAEGGQFVPAVEEWEYKRGGAKVFSFRRAYGASNATIAAGTGLPLEQVDSLAAAEDARYPEINQYFDKLAEEIEANALPTSNFVVHPANQAVRVQLRISRVATPDGKRYTFKSQPSPAFLLKRGITSTFSPTERKNYEVQGVGAQIMKLALWTIVREFYRRHNWNGKALLVNVVHDAAYRDADKSVSYESMVVQHASMLLASDLMSSFCKWQMRVPVPAGSVVGASMADEEKLRGHEFEAAVQSAHAELRARYLPGYTPSFDKLESK